MVALADAAACTNPARRRTTGAGRLRDDRRRRLAAPPVDASSYAVFDAEACRCGRRDADARRSVGSLMKLLTAVVAYDAGQAGEDVIAPDGFARSGRVSDRIGAGQVVSRSLLIRAILKVSANDAAACSPSTSPVRRRLREMMNGARRRSGSRTHMPSTPPGSTTRASSHRRRT